MKKYVLFCVIFISAFPSFGQGRDTAFAVHKLFHQKRASAHGLRATSDSAASRALYAERVGRRPRTAQEARQDALANTAFTMAGLLKASDYSAENEAAIIRRYQTGEPIPPAVRRKLKRKHFHRTERDVLNAKF